jgi:hypothetical protein
MGKHGGRKLRTGNGSPIVRHIILALYIKTGRTFYRFALHPVLVAQYWVSIGAGERVPALKWPDNVRHLLPAIFISSVLPCQTIRALDPRPSLVELKRHHLTAICELSEPELPLVLAKSRDLSKRKAFISNGNRKAQLLQPHLLFQETLSRLCQ